MKVIETEIPDVKVFVPDVFSDERGFFMETHRVSRFLDIGFELGFCQDNHSRSVQGVLRGLHYQVGEEQDKLVWVTRGKVFDVAVDIRRGSETFGKWVGVVLDDVEHRQIFVPAGFAHGFYAFEESDVVYKCSRYFASHLDRGIRWDDPEIAVEWPRVPAHVSAKDSTLPFLADVQPEDLPRFTTSA